MNSISQNNDHTSVVQMLSDISVLLMKLMLQFVTRTIRIIVQIIKLTGKLLVALTKAFIQFWNASGTREKRREFSHIMYCAFRYVMSALQLTAQALWFGIVWLATYTWKGIVWTAHKMVDAVLHLGPTLHALGRDIKYAHIQGQRRYIVFKRNGGIEGSLRSTRHRLNEQLTNYMNEDESDSNFVITNLQSEETITAMGDGDYISDEIGEDSKPRAIVNSIYDKLKKLVAND